MAAALKSASPLGLAVKRLVTPNNVTAAAAWGGTAVTGILFLTQVRRA